MKRQCYALQDAKIKRPPDDYGVDKHEFAARFQPDEHRRRALFRRPFARAMDGALFLPERRHPRLAPRKGRILPRCTSISPRSVRRLSASRATASLRTRNSASSSSFPSSWSATRRKSSAAPLMSSRKNTTTARRIWVSSAAPFSSTRRAKWCGSGAR